MFIIIGVSFIDAGKKGFFIYLKNIVFMIIFLMRNHMFLVILGGYCESTEFPGIRLRKGEKITLEDCVQMTCEEPSYVIDVLK